MDKSTLVILDLETTGLSPFSAGITEIYMRKIKSGEVIDEFHSLVNPQRSIPNFITKLTGITNEMVLNSPKINDIKDDIKNFVDGAIVVGHNINFDMNFLRHYVGIENESLCTLCLSRRVFSTNPLSSYRLSNICKHLEIPMDVTHRAKDDVLLTEQLFNVLKNKLSQINIVEVDDVKKFQKSSLSNCSKIISSKLN